MTNGPGRRVGGCSRQRIRANRLVLLGAFEMRWTSARVRQRPDRFVARISSDGVGRGRGQLVGLQSP